MGNRRTRKNGGAVVSESKPKTLLDAIRTVMNSPERKEKYPYGMTGAEMHDELAKRKWLPPLCSVLDVTNEMRRFYDELAR